MATATGAAIRPGLLWWGYAFLILATVVAFFGVQHAGSTLSAPEAVSSSPDAGKPAVPAVDVVLHVLATLAVIIGLGNVLNPVFRRLGQPPVIGEVIAGILLGPSLLGAISPWAMHALIPGADVDPQRMVLSSLKTISQMGVLLYMFIVGLELNTQKVRKNAHTAVVISHASILLPFILGSTLALWLYPIMSSSDVSFTSFALFLGVAMSITAFPVLARILTDRNMEQTEIGLIALSCAAADDVTAWCLLALVVGVIQAKVGGAFFVAVESIVFIALMFGIVKPIVSRWIARVESSQLTERALPVLLIAVLLASLSTEVIGIHAVFGAFLMGAIIPHDSQFAQDVAGKLKDVVTNLLLPGFFAVTGMNTRIGLVSGWENWLICAAIIVVATVGKFGGTVVAAQLAGVDRRKSIALGVLMNTRGLMELIVLNIGLSLGVISPRLFAMMVIMALVTTLATSPILSRLLPEETRLRTL